MTAFPNDPNIRHPKPCRLCGTELRNSNAHCHNPACDWCTPCVTRKRNGKRDALVSLHDIATHADGAAARARLDRPPRTVHTATPEGSNDAVFRSETVSFHGGPLAGRECILAEGCSEHHVRIPILGVGLYKRSDTPGVFVWGGWAS